MPLSNAALGNRKRRLQPLPVWHAMVAKAGAFAYGLFVFLGRVVRCLERVLILASLTRIIKSPFVLLALGLWILVCPASLAEDDDLNALNQQMNQLFEQGKCER